MSPWIKRVPNPHVCKRPKLNSWKRKPRVGDQWQCHECKKVYEVIEIRGYLTWMIRLLPAERGKR